MIAFCGSAAGGDFIVEKLWRTCRLMINGLAHKAQYNQTTIDTLFLPFLRRMTSLQQRKQGRILVYLAAPPGTGKTTLSLLLEKLSQTGEGVEPVQSLGLDGFQYHGDYIASHDIERDGRRIPLAAVKGDPETFDLKRLQKKLQAVRETDTRWPVYDRRRHDVVEEVITVRKKIVLLEGNWLLLRDSGWQDIHKYADYTLFISARPEELRERLIQRKIQGGTSRRDAERSYESGERLNVERVLERSWLAQETWNLLSDGDYVLQADAPKPVQLVDRQALWKKPDVHRSDEDVLIDRIQQQLASYHANAQGKSGYAEGYSEGLAAARREILRGLYNNGRMTSKELLSTFQLEPEELAEILLGRGR